MTNLRKLLTSPYGFAIVAFVLFGAAALGNTMLGVPAVGAWRLLAFTPLGLWCLAKARTMIR